MDSIIFYEPPASITKRNRKAVTKRQILPPSQDRNKEDSGRCHGHSEGFSGSMKEQSRDHPPRTTENLEVSRGLRATRNNSSIDTNRDMVITLSDYDSDDNEPRASSGYQSGHSSGGPRQGTPSMNTDDFLETQSFAAHVNMSSSPDYRKGSHKNTRTPNSCLRVSERQNDGVEGGHGEDPTLVFASSPGNVFGNLTGSPTGVATDSSIACEDNREAMNRISQASEHWAAKDFEGQSMPETGRKSKSILTKTEGDDMGRQGGDFVNRLPKEQRNQYAPLDSRQKPLQKNRTRTTSTDSSDHKRKCRRLEQGASIPTLRHPPPVDPEDCQYLVERLLERRTRKHSKKFVTQYLVRWLGYEEDEDCWVDEADIHPELREQFLVTNSPLWPVASRSDF